jgi:hypothetical protein
MTWWVGVRRPLLVAFLLGCSVSLMTSGRVLPRLAFPATIYWSFVPLCQIGALAAVSRRRKMAFGRLIDIYFESHTAWLLWTIVFAAIWAIVPTRLVYRWLEYKWLWYASAWAVIAWSAYRDFGFFRRVLERTPGRALADLLVQRALSWGVGLAIFLAPGGWQAVASALRL